MSDEKSTTTDESPPFDPTAVTGALPDGSEPLTPAYDDSDRYARLELADDSVIVYDRERTDAWIQSDTARSLPVAPADVADGASPLDDAVTTDRSDSGGD
ncbi:hypothetical protein Hbl1158_15895 (plasmid) [Halobaculum sp. CBA1158]|uniref:hypothetical protein n=1 Tax=Halobaculum sp. CBA1158 TaxID=2904243 RepID=UPI001F469A9D|nr:hypothetical protein [Halobaculum sp. CBA1158]UIP01390.1 hypothetical protein Hbl1158_15895 [Halobaculum sp. CBA1158]